MVHLLKCLLRSLLLAVAISSAVATAPAYTIVIASSSRGVNTQSDGSPIDTSFKFQLGTFLPGFAPDETNTGLWPSNWVTLTTPTGEPDPLATADYGTIGNLFGTFEGFNTEVSLTHNQTPFGAGAKLYLWGYDVKQGDAEWILMSGADSDPWIVQDTNNLVFTAIYDTANAEAILGNLSGAPDYSFQTAGVALRPVPEPTPALLCCAVFVLAISLRRRK